MIKRTITMVRPSTDIKWPDEDTMSVRYPPDTTFTLSDDELTLIIVAHLTEQMPAESIADALAKRDKYNSDHGITFTSFVETI